MNLPPERAMIRRILLTYKTDTERTIVSWLKNEL
jgi:hypothetical protein